MTTVDDGLTHVLGDTWDGVRPCGVNGHEFLPICGQEFSPLADMITPRRRTWDLPTSLGR